MATESIQILDLSVDLSDPESAAYDVLWKVKPDWQKEDIEIMVRLQNASDL